MRSQLITTLIRVMITIRNVTAKKKRLIFALEMTLSRVDKRLENPK